jgi:hypothetical protein
MEERIAEKKHSEAGATKAEVRSQNEEVKPYPARASKLCILTSYFCVPV